MFRLLSPQMPLNNRWSGCPKRNWICSADHKLSISAVHYPAHHRSFFHASHTRIPFLCLRNPFRTDIPEGKILEIPSTFLFFLLSFLPFKPLRLFPSYMWWLVRYNIAGMVVLLTTFWNGNSWNSYVLVWRVRTVVTSSAGHSVETAWLPLALRRCTNHKISSKRFWTDTFPQVP